MTPTTPADLAALAGAVPAVADAACPDRLGTLVLSVNEETTTDEMFDLRGRLECAIRAAQELKKRLERDHIVPRLEATGGYQVGGIRFYAGHDKDTKCLDVAGTVEAVLTATNGDVASFASCLAADAFKHGAVRKILSPEDYGRLFHTKVKPKIEAGKPRKVLLSVNEEFINNRAGAVPAQAKSEATL